MRQHSSVANIKPPFAVWTETPSGGTVTVKVITGAGGFMQSVVFGYGGLRLREGRLDTKVPPLPSGTDTLTLNGVHYRGNKLRIAISATSVSVEVLETEAEATALHLCDPSGLARPLLASNPPVKIGRSDAASIRPVGTCG